MICCVNLLFISKKKGSTIKRGNFFNINLNRGRKHCIIISFFLFCGYYYRNVKHKEKNYKSYQSKYNCTITQILF